jgi:hypothetical protein
MKYSLALSLALGVLLGEVCAADTAASADIGNSQEKTSALPAEVDLRPELNKLNLGPRRQGHRGTCSVFTTAAAMEFALSKQQNKNVLLSVEYLNWGCNQVINNDRDRGQFFHHLLEGFEKYGVCLETEMPYRRNFDATYQPSESAQERARTINADCFQIHWIKKIGRRNNEPGLQGERFEEAKRVLAAGWPVAAGAGHSRLLVGYKDDAASPGGGIFYTKDSGIGRYDQVTYEFVKTQVNDAFWVEPIGD